MNQIRNDQIKNRDRTSSLETKTDEKSRRHGSWRQSCQQIDHFVQIFRSSWRKTYKAGNQNRCIKRLPWFQWFVHMTDSVFLSNVRFTPILPNNNPPAALSANWTQKSSSGCLRLRYFYEQDQFPFSIRALRFKYKIVTFSWNMT